MEKTKRDAQPISCLMLYGGGQLAASGKCEDGESPTESMESAAKLHFLARGASEHRTSKSCARCQQREMEDKTQAEKKRDCIREAAIHVIQL